MHAWRLAAALICVAALAVPPASAQPAALMIELRSFAFTPRVILLPAGKRVTLSFVNRSRDAHDFTARAFFARSQIIAGSAPGGEVELKGGQSRSITLIPAAGRYKLHCGHFLHKQFGMTGEIRVQ